MNSAWRVSIGFGLAVILSAGAFAAEPVSGWRGNATGLWPECTALLEWHRLAHGAMEGLRGQANLPQLAEVGDAPLVRKGLPAEWLVLGPFTVADSVANLDDDLLGTEKGASPNAGDQTAGFAWRKIAPKQDDPMDFGAAVLPWVELAKPEEFEKSRIAYAHTWIYSPRGGPVRGIVEHCFGLKAWVNGHEVYRSLERHANLAGYESISRHELAHAEAPDGRFECPLQPGWNRLLLKLSSSNREGHKEMAFCLRLMDPPDVPYESQNIRWISELPGRSTSTPIIVANRIFVAAEPDLLVCLDKESGRVLWSAANNYYEAMSLADRNANPAFAALVDPLVAALRTETNRERRLDLRRQMHEALVKIDPARFDVPNDGHFAAHFGIVGFTMPTPVSDGTHVYVWCGMGVAACYDLDGRRQWITRLPVEHLEYGSSPALADGVLAVFLGKLFGLDAKSGELRWTQPRIHKNIAAVLAARLAGQPVFITQPGEIIRPSDGKLLYRPRSAVTGDGGCWAPPVILGEIVYGGQFGVNQTSITDFGNVTGDAWKPEVKATFDLDVPRQHNLKPDGHWLDHSTAGSPVVFEGLAYKVDIYGWFYVIELEARKLVYYRKLELDGLMHYNAVPVAASPTLIGNKLVVVDNQGTALVLATGREFQVLARNRIETQLDRPWPIPAQETLAYAPPIADGEHLYLRGERYLYCIGTK
jgi:hypothetical protein